MRVLSPEERCERMKAALAEAGYPDDDTVALVSVDPERYAVSPSVPDEAFWRAAVVADPAGIRCWPCWSKVEDWGTDHIDNPCTHDPLTSPWPEVVR